MPPQPGVRRAQTRSRLLVAAMGVFAEEGYGGATVEAVATAAGLTRGAFYSSFADKADLFLALLDDHTDTQLARTQALVSTAAPEAALATAAEAAGRVSDEDRRWFLLSTEFTLLAVRDPVVAERLAAHDLTIRESLAELLGEALTRAGRRATVALTDLASLVVAIREGALMQSCVDPAAVPPGHLERVFFPLLLTASSVTR